MLEAAENTQPASKCSNPRTVPRTMGRAEKKSTTARDKSKRLRKPGRWERGYRKHVYWIGRRKLGEITLGEHENWDGRYVWAAPIANLRGSELSLAKAKSCVEAALKGNVYQYDLFSEDASGDAQ